MTIKLLRWLRGSVEFSVRGGQSPERLINLCAKEGVPLWGCRNDDDGFFAFTTPEGYRRVGRMARTLGGRARVGHRKGARFLVWRYRRRYGLAAGVLLFCVLLLLSQQFIWQVRVEGTEQLDPRVLISALRELDVHPGMRKNSVDQKWVARELRLRVDGLSWTALNFYGTTAILKINEREAPPPKVDTSIPANLVAAQDGQIHTLRVYDGRPVVKQGDAVCKGDLLVSGVWEDRWGMTRLIRAKGEAFAHVPMTLQVKVPYEQENLKLTGRIQTRRYLELFDFQLPLFIYSGLDGCFKLEFKESPVYLFGARLPMGIKQERYVFYEQTYTEMDREQALAEAKKQLGRLERKTFRGESVISRELRAEEQPDCLVLYADYVVDMDIAKQTEIPLLRGPGDEPAKPLREGGY